VTPPVELVGATLDRYHLTERLGEGGMAAVYKAQHTILGSWHAIKVLRPELVAHRTIRDRFLAEGRIAAQIRHPNVVDVTDVLVAPGVAGLVMEFLDGPALDQVVDGWASPPDTAEILSIFLPILDGVAEAHAFGVIHRDLKPANVLLAKDRRGRHRPVILDFGIAKLAAETRVDHPTRRPTDAGTRMGTPAYMAPEQVRESREVDVRSDVFALGAILYELCTGEIAFGAASEFDSMQAVVAGRCRDPQDLRPDLHPVLAGAIRTALRVDPDDRFADCEAFATALGAALATAPVAPTSPGAPAAAPTRPSPAPARPGAVSEPAVAAARDPAVARAPSDGRLVVRSDATRLVVGRGPDCDVVVDDPLASEVHCVVTRHGVGATVEDLKSALGTLVNDRLIVGRHRLVSGDVLTVGRTPLTVEIRGT
jgi:serine/threonine protein kinase